MALFNTNKAQLLYYQNTYKGGVSFDGITYSAQGWQSPDTIHFQNSIPIGSTLKRAFLISYKVTCQFQHIFPHLYHASLRDDGAFFVFYFCVLLSFYLLVKLFLLFCADL